MRNNNFCVVVIRDRGNDPALDEMWKGLRSLANAYLFRLRNVKTRRRKRPFETDPSIPPPVPPVVPVPPAAPVRPPAPIPPAPVKPSPPVSYVQVVKSPPKAGPIYDRRIGPAPTIPVIPRPASTKPVGSTQQSPVPSLVPKKSFIINVAKNATRPLAEEPFCSGATCPSCGVYGKVKCGKWFRVDHKDWSPGVYLCKNFEIAASMSSMGLCDNCWLPVGKRILAGSLSGDEGGLSWTRGEVMVYGPRYKK